MVSLLAKKKFTQVRCSWMNELGIPIYQLDCWLSVNKPDDGWNQIYKENLSRNSHITISSHYSIIKFTPDEICPESSKKDLIEI